MSDIDQIKKLEALLRDNEPVLRKMLPSILTDEQRLKTTALMFTTGSVMHHVMRATLATLVAKGVKAP